MSLSTLAVSAWIGRLVASVSACLETDDSPADAVGRTVDEWSGDGGVECRCSQHADLLHVAS